MRARPPPEPNLATNGNGSGNGSATASWQTFTSKLEQSGQEFDRDLNALLAHLRHLDKGKSL